MNELLLVDPNPIRDASFALSWFTSPFGRETLLLMGNAEHEINTPSLNGETQKLREFINLKERNEQLTWMLQVDGKTVGAAWVELVENHGVHPPSIHLMIGDKEYRGRGIGKATMAALIDYIIKNLETSVIYSRHLKNNIIVATMNQRLGFLNDGDLYIDKNGLEWHNVKLAI
jgi:RimJ/RimL family protein N-acetyltransferase